MRLCPLTNDVLSANEFVMRGLFEPHWCIAAMLLVAPYKPVANQLQQEHDAR